MKNRFLDFLNSKLVIGFFIFIMLSLANVLAGDVIVKEGKLIVEDGINASNLLFVNSGKNKVGIGVANPKFKLDIRGKARAKDFLFKPFFKEEVLFLANLTGFNSSKLFFKKSQSVQESIALLVHTNKKLLERIDVLEKELCLVNHKNRKNYSWCEDTLPNKEKREKKIKNRDSRLNLMLQNKSGKSKLEN